MVRILLVRHGQSVWNAEGRWQGQADPPLSEVGEAQARAAATHLDGIGVVATSDLQRAAATAAIVGEALGVPVVAEPGLRERCAGRWEGLTRAEIEAGWPGWLAARRWPDGWEGDEAVLARALPALGRLARLGAERGADVLAVSHAGVIRTVERHLASSPSALPNLGGRWFEVAEDGTLVAGPRAVLLDGDEAPLTVPRSL